MTEVVAALIWKDGKFLGCQRPPHKARGMLWEFVGGKVEPGESREEALIRECKEELGVDILVNELFMDVFHRYPDISVHLSVFSAKIKAGIPQKLEHIDLQWIAPSEIEKFCFCPADEDILSAIKNM